jgi:S-adenosylmethionine:tRNA ribosyltransferase-isomerase
MKDHEMHAEFIDVSVESLEKIISYLNKTIVVVGTTSARTIESLYWMGVKISRESAVRNKKNIHIDDITIHQWDAYELPANLSVKESLEILLQWLKENNLKRLITKTQIIIAPGYDLKIIKGLITNFHQPQSTLLLLVAAIIGDDWKKIYHYALENDFRFLSYGDGSLLWKR